MSRETQTVLSPPDFSEEHYTNRQVAIQYPSVVAWYIKVKSSLVLNYNLQTWCNSFQSSSHILFT